MKHTICSVKGTFHGLYEWGTGWKDNRTAKKWKHFWKKADGTFWHHTIVNGTEYLVCTQGSIFLHPMDFSALLSDTGAALPGKTFFTGELDELNRICRACAEACGGSFELETSNETVTDTGELKTYTK